MTRETIHLVLVAMLACSPVALAESSTDEIIANYLEARGGLDKLEAIKTVRRRGTMSFQGGHAGLRLPVVVEYQPPNHRMRLEYEMQGMTIVQAYDGQSGWSISPLLGKAEAQEMAGVELQRVREQADFHGSLVKHEEKGYTIELMGKEDVEGTEAYKLKVTKSGGGIDYFFLDTEYYLPIRKLSRLTVDGEEVESVIDIGDYKVVDGVLFAHFFAVVLPGGSQVMSYDSIELDVSIPDERFMKPGSES